jgi:hypothetical protein
MEFGRDAKLIVVVAILTIQFREFFLVRKINYYKISGLEKWNNILEIASNLPIIN